MVSFRLDKSTIISIVRWHKSFMKTVYKVSYSTIIIITYRWYLSRNDLSFGTDEYQGILDTLLVVVYYALAMNSHYPSMD